MTQVSAALFAVATELAKLAKESLPEMRDGEKLCREWYDKGIYYRKTVYNGKVFVGQYDFRKRESRQETVEND